jgi:hypothetical protein
MMKYLQTEEGAGLKRVLDIFCYGTYSDYKSKSGLIRQPTQSDGIEPKAASKAPSPEPAVNFRKLEGTFH